MPQQEENFNNANYIIKSDHSEHQKVTICASCGHLAPFGNPQPHQTVPAQPVAKNAVNRWIVQQRGVR